LVLWITDGTVGLRANRKEQGVGPILVNTLNVATSGGRIRSSRSHLNPWSSRRANASN